MSRIEAGQFSVVSEEIDAAEAIGEVLDLVRPLATSSDIELLERPPTAVGAHRLHADRRCVRQVLINLVANAVKYTPPGGRVCVDVTPAPDAMLRIGVTDSGPGLSSDSIAELFQPFHRLEREGPAHPEGTGLGLALSARLMDEMDGRIGVDSVPGTGSCFWVEFPRSSSVPSADLAAAARSEVGLEAKRSARRNHVAQAVDSFEQRGKVDRLGHEAVESAVGGVVEHVG